MQVYANRCLSAAHASPGLLHAVAGCAIGESMCISARLYEREYFFFRLLRCCLAKRIAGLKRDLRQGLGFVKLCVVVDFLLALVTCFDISQSDCVLSRISIAFEDLHTDRRK